MSPMPYPLSTPSVLLKARPCRSATADTRNPTLHGTGAWLPTSDDQECIESLMTSHLEPGRFAPWIAPPNKGIDQKPRDFE